MNQEPLPPSQNAIPAGYQIVFYTNEYDGEIPATTFMKGMTEGKARFLYDILKHLQTDYTKDTYISTDDALDMILTYLNKHRDHLDSDLVFTIDDCATEGDSDDRFSFVREFLSNDLPVTSLQDISVESALSLRIIDVIDVFYTKDVLTNFASTFEA